MLLVGGADHGGPDDSDSDDTETTDETPAVRLQPCAAFQFARGRGLVGVRRLRMARGRPPRRVETGGAEITELPRRRTSVPDRLAS